MNESASTPPPIFFNHIAKCAGTSIGTLLSHGYTADDLHSTEHNATESARLIPYRVLREKRLIWGHFGDWPRQRLGKRTAVVTMRDPWSRMCSLLKHYARTPNGLGSLPMKTYALDPTDENLDAPGVIEGISISRQIEYLIDPASVDTVGYGTDEERLIAEAKENLDQYDVIITTETIDDAARHLADLVGAPPIEKAPRLNTSSNWAESERVQPAPEHEGRLRELMYTDAAIYERGSQIALRQRDSYKKSTAEYEHRYLQTLSKDQRSREWCLDWNGIVRGSGWGLRQRPSIAGYEQSWARIIEAPQAFIDCPIKPAPAMIAEVVMWVDNADAYDNLRIILGDAEPEWQRLRPIQRDKSLAVWRARVTEGCNEPATRLRFSLKPNGTQRAPELWLLDAHLRPA